MCIIIKLLYSLFIMSVYSGFATRQQQSKYNNLLQNLVIALKKRLIKFYNQEACDQHKFKLLMKKIYKKMFLLEKGKFMAPKYTTCFHDLIQNLNIQINYDTLSDASSLMSQTFSLKKEPNDTQNDIFKSRAILQTKRNHLQSQQRLHPMNSSAFSLSKKFNTMQVDNNLQTDQKRSTSLGMENNNFDANRSKIKIKLRQLRDVRQLRGTMSMPKVQDFLPKKQQIAPAFFHQKPVLKQPKAFRRQKYSRNDISIQQI